MQKFNSDWRSRAFKCLAVLVLVVLLLQPETWHLALTLDAMSLDALALLLDAQFALMLAVLGRQWLLPAWHAAQRHAVAPARRWLRRNGGVGPAILEACLLQLRAVWQRGGVASHA
ncbi:MAG TPA: hypothetical protein VFN09_07115 [Rhodanobacteraceae bacterium]|nr:hypothetical protein [Rhodanobacteraceae bacterium]